MRRLLSHPHRLKLLPQPALPEVPGPNRESLARRPSGRPAAGALLPRGLHPADARRSSRVPEQGRGLRPAVPDRRRHAHHDRSGPEAPRRQDRPHGRAVYVGIALTHHPHVHVVVPGGGLAPHGSRWIACRPGFFLPMRVLSRLFRRLFLDRLADAQRIGRLAFHGDLAHLSDPAAFAAHLAPLRRSEWVVYAKHPFAGPEAVLAYLSHYTHRVASSNSRLLALDDRGVTFRWKDYRARDGAPGREWIKSMTLSADEFIRRFLLHALPSGFHRVRHYGLF